MAKEWYVVKIYSGHDKKILPVIEQEIEISGVSDLIEEVVVPMETVVEMKNGKKKEKNKVFFPGYILVKMELNLLNTPGIVSFVGPNNQPQALRDAEVNRILKRVVESQEESTREKIQIPFKVGDSVRVVDGPFNDFKGVVEEINEEKLKIKVMVSIFGRSTPVELDFMQVVIEEQ